MWDDVIKPIAKLFFWVIVIGFGMGAIAHCSYDSNVKRRQEQRAECVRLGGTYIASMNKDANPRYDSCALSK